REHGLGPLPDLAGAGQQRYLAEVIELQDRATSVRTIDARAAADVVHARVADSALRAWTRRPSNRARDLALHPLETLRHRARGADGTWRVDVAALRCVPPPEVHGIDAEAFRQLVHLRFDGERALEVAVPAHRARVRVVRVDDRRVEAHRLHAIQAHDGRQHHV